MGSQLTAAARPSNADEIGRCYIFISAGFGRMAGCPRVSDFFRLKV